MINLEKHPALLDEDWHHKHYKYYELIKGTLMQIWNLPIFSSLYENNVLKISHWNNFYFLKNAAWDMWKACLQTFRINIVCLKLAYHLRHLRTSRANNSRIILRITNAKFSGYFFCTNINILGDFQICNGVPLTQGSFGLKPDRQLLKSLFCTKCFTVQNTELLPSFMVFFRKISTQRN